MHPVTRCLGVTLGIWLCVPLLAADATESDPQKTPSAASVTGVAIQTEGSQIFFRVSCTWPPADEAEEDAVAASRQLFPMPPDGIEPPDAVALIPQTPDAFLVFAQPIYDIPEREAVFLGKLKRRGTQEFLLRCPGVAGRSRYLPVRVDFLQASESRNLDAQWMGAQTALMRRLAGSDSHGFFAYAHQRMWNRLQGSNGEPPDRGRPEDWRPPPRGREQLYEVTTGALAMQESLQLDRMTNASPDTGPRDVPIDQIEGVTVQSHPWREMMGSKQPSIEPIAALVPDDQYYVRFRTTRSMRDFLEFADRWGGSVLAQVETGGRNYGVRAKVEAQLCLRASWLSDLLGPAVIESLVLTGCDPYLREGSDLSIIFRLKARPVFEAAVQRYINEARAHYPDLEETRELHGNVSIERLATGDGTVRCYRAWLGEYCVYSNSPAGIRRIIDTQAGSRASMAASLDFAYMRTVYPLDASEEDGLIFLSDVFIRTLVGPRVRIAEKRRLEAVTSLEMIKNAALLYLWENPGAAVPDLQTLYQGGWLDPKHVTGEPGDRISWDPATFTASSERYGRLGYLTPILELAVDRASATERQEYQRFRDQYQNYWRRYFDPIGIRVTAREDIDVSVTILPLIAQSRYDELQSMLGGQVTSLAPAVESPSRVLHLAAHLNPAGPVRQIQSLPSLLGASNQRPLMPWIGERFEFWIEDTGALLQAIRDHEFGSVFKIPMTAALKVKNPLGLAGFLLAMQAMVQTSAPNTVIFEALEPYRGITLTQVRPAPDGWMADDHAASDASLYYGTIGGYLYLSTSREILHNVVDQLPSRATTQTAPTPSESANAPPPGSRGESAGPSAPAAPPASTAPSAFASTGNVAATSAKPPLPPVQGHLAITVDLAAARQARAALEYYLVGGAWQAEADHLRNLWLLARTVGFDGPGAPPPQAVLGYRIESALGNRYRYEPARDEVVGSQTGSLWNPLPAESLPADSPLANLLGTIDRLRAALRFTEHGLQTEVHVDRAEP